MLSLKEILKLLYAGKKLIIPFASGKEREAFRQRLYKAKKQQDKVLTDILDEDRMELRCQFIDTTEADEHQITSEVIQARFWLENKPSQQFEVTIEN